MRPIPNDARTVSVEPDAHAGYQALAGYGPYSSEDIRRLAMSLSGHVTPGVPSGPLFGEIRLWLPTALGERDQFREFRDHARVFRHVGGSGTLSAEPGFVCPVPPLAFVGSALEDSSDSESRDMAACLGRFRRFWMGGAASGFIPPQVVEDVLSMSREHVVDSWFSEASESDSGSVDGHIPFPESIARVWLDATRRESYEFCFDMDESLSDGCSDSSSDLPLRPLWSESAPLDPVTSLGELEWAAVGMAPQESHYVWSQMWKDGHYDLSDAERDRYEAVLEEDNARLLAELEGEEGSFEYENHNIEFNCECPKDTFYEQRVYDWLNSPSHGRYELTPCPEGNLSTPTETTTSYSYRTFRQVVHDYFGAGMGLYYCRREFVRHLSRSIYSFLPVSEGKWGGTTPELLHPPPDEYAGCTREVQYLLGDAVHFLVSAPSWFLNVALAGATDADPLARRSHASDESESESERQIQVDPDDLFFYDDAYVIFTGRASWSYAGDGAAGDGAAGEDSSDVDRTSRRVDDRFYVSVPLSSLSPTFTYDRAGLWMHCSGSAIDVVLASLPERAAEILGMTEADVPMTDFPYPAFMFPRLAYAEDTNDDPIREILVAMDYHDASIGSLVNSFLRARTEDVGMYTHCNIDSYCVLVARWKFRARLRR